MDIKFLLEVAKKAAVEAGKEIMKVYSLSDLGVEHKEDESPLTKADKAAHASIVSFLETTNIPVLSEEGASIPYSERKLWKQFWMVDPLDGTKEFIKRNGEFTVNIALVEDGVPVLGVVYVPVQEQLFYAAKGSGAFSEIDELVSPLKLSSNKSLNGLRVVASRSHLNSDTKNFMDGLEDPEIVSMGSSLKFICIAKGAAEVYPRFAPTMEWDSAAADAICREMGLVVKNVETEKALTYNKENLLNPYFIVARPEILEQLA